ncbi:MAG: nucleoside recognition domain-containing protein [Bacillota bacterium]|jgi:ferrous iron transport protein B
MNGYEAGRFKDLAEQAGKIRQGREHYFRDAVVGHIYGLAEEIAGRTVRRGQAGLDWDRRLDDILTSRLLGFPIMLLLLGVVFWVTIIGANYLSEFLASFFSWSKAHLLSLGAGLGLPLWLQGFLVEGVYGTVGWVVAVMLPPMAIFFPIFTLLEDLGYLPRVAFNLDNFFKRAGAHGKQALTMSMGFGCNAAGVIACRVIESPRERLIATLTNTFVPCNGRFPTLIALAMIFMGGAVAAAYSTAIAAVVVVGIVLFGVVITFVVSWLLSRTILKGLPSTFTLELPPYRKPQVAQVLVRSILDRTIFVLGRAVIIAAPAGGIIWILANISVGEVSAIAYLAGLLDPVARAMGLDGFILMAFILGLPANEIVLPVLIMSYLATGAMLELDSLQALKTLLVDQHGWTWLTALCTMLFALMHYPCGTTLFTIQRETRSAGWTLLAALIPLAVGCLVCFLVAQTVRMLGLV